MVASVEPRVEIDDRIRGNAALLGAVSEALAFLGRHVRHVPLPAAIRWRSLPLDPNSVELQMSDDSDFRDAVRRVFRCSELYDEYARQIGTLDTWRELLRSRSRKNWARIDALMSRVALAAAQESDE